MFMSKHRLPRPQVLIQSIRDSRPVLFSTSSFKATRPCLYRSFSTSIASRKENNKQRGVSAIRRTGPRTRLSVHKFPLPKPVLDPAKRSKVQVDEDHGLWGFFNKGKDALVTPVADAAHGMSILCQASLSRPCTKCDPRSSLER